MRVLLTINVLALVVLAAAAAIVSEGTPLEDITGWSLVRADRLAELEALEAAHLAGQGGERDVALPAPRPHEAGDEGAEKRLPQKLVIATEGAFPPFNFTGEDGAPKGMEIELVRALCGQLALECTFVTAPWGALLPGLRDGKYDLIAASLRIPHEAEEGVFYSAPYYATPGRFAARSSALPEAERETGTLPPLRDKKVLVEEGSLHEAFLKARFPLAKAEGAPSFAAAWAALTRGQADYIFADARALESRLSESACCEPMGPLYSNPDYFGAGIGFAMPARHRALAAKIDESLQKMRASGALEALARAHNAPVFF